MIVERSEGVGGAGNVGGPSDGRVREEGKERELVGVI